MKRIQLLCEICGLLLFCAAIYIFAPTLKSRVEAAWMVREPKTMAVAELPVKAPEVKPSISKVATDATVETDNEGPAVGPPDPGSLRWQSIHPNEPVPVRVPIVRTRTFSFMPGQAVNLMNKQFRKVTIRSDYPLRVLSGPCHQDYTVQFFCDGDPADIFISDTRRMPVFMTPKANSVTITVVEF